MRPDMAVVHEIVADHTAGDTTEAQCLAELRARGYTPDPVALEDAATAVADRDALIHGALDPIDWNHALGHRDRDWCISRAEDLHEEALAVLAVPLCEPVTA